MQLHRVTQEYYGLETHSKAYCSLRAQSRKWFLILVKLVVSISGSGAYETFFFLCFLKQFM